MWQFVLLHFVTYYLNLHGLHPEVNFINVLRAAFMSADPKRAKKIDNFTVFFALSGKKLLVERWWNWYQVGRNLCQTRYFWAPFQMSFWQNCRFKFVKSHRNYKSKTSRRTENYFSGLTISWSLKNLRTYVNSWERIFELMVR